MENHVFGVQYIVPNEPTNVPQQELMKFARKRLIESLKQSINEKVTITEAETHLGTELKAEVVVLSLEEYEHMKRQIDEFNLKTIASILI
ncbi:MULTISPECIES: hypothetical protein [unclassified Exiguobacterium]|uniref:hypothetical protein n=1 Tax=unclassified Exiguobacterium TaxID=2644629 RepID=UPI001BEC11D3|nr:MULTISPECIES: hypothetical protein [unclassified Exiguobacterium]